MAGERDVYRIIQGMITEAIANIALPEPAVVTAVFPDTYTVQCMLVYDQVVTGQLRVMESYTGRGFGITNLPKAGDEVMVIFQGGRPNDGYVVGRLYGPDDPPPSFQYGDWQLKHESGASLLLDAAGSATIKTNGGTLALSADGKFAVRNLVGVDLLAVLSELMQDILDAAPTFTDPTTGVLNPALEAQLVALKASLDTLKQ